MSTEPPRAIAAADVETVQGTGYPAPYDAPCAERLKRKLGDQFGLADFGVNMVTLPPGCWSSQRHWHSLEDEFIHVLEGHPTLVTDAGETALAPGMCAGFKAGTADGHHLVNRTDAPVTYLEVGSRKLDDDVDYPDHDLQLLKAKRGGWFTRRNGDAA